MRTGWSGRRCAQELHRSAGDAGRYIVSSPQGVDKVDKVDKVEGENPVKEVRELEVFSVEKRYYEEMRDSEVIVGDPSSP